MSMVRKVSAHRKGDTRETLRKLVSSSRKYWPSFVVSTILLLGSVVFIVIAPTYLKAMTDEIADKAVSMTIDIPYVAKIGSLLAAFYVGSALLGYAANFIITAATQKYSRDLREAITAKINRIPLRYFDSHATGDTLSRLTNDVDQIATSLQQAAGMLIQSLLTLVAVLIAMFVTSWRMALTVMISLPLMALFMLMILKLAQPQFIKRQELIGKVDGVVEENFSGQIVIKCFDAAERVNAAFEKDNHQLQETMVKAQFFGGLMMPIMNFISYFVYAAVCIAGGLFLNAKLGVTMGTITAFLVYVNLFQSPLSQIAQGLNTLQTAAAASKRVFAFLSEGELTPEKTSKRLFLDGNGHESLKGAVDFENVHFGYDEGREIIHGFSCHVKAGSKVAIVGPTGAGKTTMVNLLMRFYEINSGSIKIDGVPIRDMSRAEIHDIFGMVLQDTWMFEGSMRENIVYNTESRTEADIQKVCQEANISHFIDVLPDGLDCHVDAGSNISGGQKQLITIARAMLRRNPLMILDEATSNVDTRTEELIQQAMDKLTKGRTSFVIAHRLSTIKNADLILVMNEGAIVEQGNHETLMAQNGFYASLYNSQFAFM
ncbi:MAG: ABC transporter ATP-binding protein/permease [Bacilli bacterium]|jgi:ATP-binding cassette subfamily B protein|nr:ABC transporter ATP-binding protein/permease [Bacilli bacterium]